MNRTSRQPHEGAIWTVAFALALPILLLAPAASAQVRYLSDGAVQNTYGGFDLPLQGSCTSDPSLETRPQCTAVRKVAASSGACTTAGGSWSTGVCNDSIALDQATCEGRVDRFWNAGSGICAIVMQDDDRNDAVCMMHNGTWTSGCTGVWTMPNGNAYTPPVITGLPTSPAGAGDQCLRCHNSVTQYNGPRVRDTEETMFMGHLNMARKVTVGTPWGGPPFECTVAPLVHLDQDACYDAGGNWVPQNPYPGTDSGQDLNWVTGQIDLDVTAGTNFKDLRWIYGDWLSAYPRAIYADDPDTVPNPDKPKVSYSCGRCHTTGWTSDATLRTDKEPEKSWPGITWDGVADATFGQVNLAGGVSGDTNKMSSWDVWGISCARCHNSAIDYLVKTCTGGTVTQTSCTTAGGAWDTRNNVCTSTEAECTAAGGAVWDIPYGAPKGMSTHHNDLTTFDVGSSGAGGYCTDSRFNAQTQCDAAGAAWLTACTVPGTCSNATYTTSGTCFLAGETWTKNTTSGDCTADGGTWLYVASSAACSIPGICNDPAMTTSATCTGTVAAGPLTGLVRQWRALTSAINCEDAGGHWTGNKINRGQIITNLCMDCHRQETGGKPYDGGANPAGAIKVGVYHSTLTFLSHWHGNQYLNSPHGKFSGTFAQIPTAKFGYGGPAPLYKSHFLNDGEAANTGNGCTGCHEVHSSTVTGKEPFREECTECHAKDVNQLLHPSGVGTPVESKLHPNEACVACHMPEGMHLFRINVDETYATIPQTALTGTQNAATAPDGNYADAVWVDLDAACGKCHGGGIAHVVTTGAMTAGSPTLTVADSSLFTAGQRIEVEGAGGYYYDDLGVNKFNDTFHGYIKTIASPTTLTLTGNATATVTNAEVEQNPIKNNAAYFTKTQLAGYAKGMHNDKPVVYFSYKLGNPNTLQVNVDASASSCSGSLANCNAFSWNWGDSSPAGSGVTATHTYAAAGTYPITLTVTEYAIGSGERTLNVSVYAPDFPPTVGGTCVLDANTWVATVTDASSDDNGVAQVVVNWGDNSVVSSDTTAPFGPFGHTYIQPGSFTVARKVVDTIGQQTIDKSCVLTPAYFTLSGTVRRLNDTPVQLAAITVKKGLMTIRTVYSDVNGNYSVGNLKPGTYNLTAKKAGLTFAQVYNVLVGPSSGGYNFQSAQ